MRCFIAIDFPERVKKTIAEIQAELKKSGADVKWVNPHQIHLTLYFFKELQPEKVELLSEKLKKEIHDKEVFELTLQGVGSFPQSGDPRVIWVGIQNSQELTALYKKIQEIGQSFDEDKLKTAQGEKYTPHATIGRVRSKKNIHRIKEMMKVVSPDPVGFCRISELIFYESRLSQKGPDYFELDRFSLKPQLNL